MKPRSASGALPALLAGVFCLQAAGLSAQESKTIVGSVNPALQEGADALMAGDAEDGVRLTQIGLSRATSSRERLVAKSNLCAGYALLGKYETALAYCDEVLAENDRHWYAYSNRALIYVKLKRYSEAEQDLLKGEAIRPQARTLRDVRRMYLDATRPVSPNIVIDDRRRPASDATETDDETDD